MNKFLVILFLFFFACRPTTLTEVADLNAEYPDIDVGLGITYPVAWFRNYSTFVRLGPIFVADLNRDLSTPDWVSLGAAISREIQPYITLGGSVGYRFMELEGIQWAVFLGVDLWPFDFWERD